MVLFGSLRSVLLRELASPGGDGRVRARNKKARLPLEAFAVFVQDAAQAQELQDSMTSTVPPFYDVFLSHAWGPEKTTHAKVVAVAEGLQKLGISCWLDEKDIRGDVLESMVNGIDRSRACVIFVTRDYMDKVNKKLTKDDNCRGEFHYAMKRQKPARLIPCVLDPTMTDTSDWKGQFGFCWNGNPLYVPMLSEGEPTDEELAELAQRIRELYISLVDESDVGREFQGTFVSQARRCRFQDLVAAIEGHFGQDADSAFVWLDLFCANQPLLTSADEALSADDVLARNQYLTHGVHRAIGRFGSAVIFFDRWDAPAPLQRAWCVWEIMGAISFAQNFEVVFAPGQERAFVEALLKAAKQMAKVLADNNDMRKAKCWKNEDKEMIDNAVATTVDGGYVTLIAEVNQRVRTWRLQMARDAVTQARKGVRVDLATILVRTGQLLASQGEYQEALRMLEEALSMRKESFGDRHREVAATLKSIASVYNSQGRYEEALAYYDEALSIKMESLGDRHLFVASTLHNIAGACLAQGRYKEALAYFEEALSIVKESLGDQDPVVVTTLGNIASVYHAQGRYEEALEYCEEALAIRKGNLGDRHPNVAGSLNNTAVVYKEQGRYEEALAYYNEALSIMKESLGDRHPSVAATLNNIATIYELQGRYEEALAHYHEALSIMKESLGDRHPDMAGTLHNIAAVYESQGRYEEALAYYEEALSIRKESLDDRHPDVTGTLRNIEIIRERMQASQKRPSPLQKLACLWGKT